MQKIESAHVTDIQVNNDDICDTIQAHMKEQMLSADEMGLPVRAAIEATVAWANGAASDVFHLVEGVLGPLDLPLVSYIERRRDRIRVRAWLATAASRVKREPQQRKTRGTVFGRSRTDTMPVAKKSTKEVKRELWPALATLTSALRAFPIHTKAGVRFALRPTGFVNSTPMTWSALATSSLLEDPAKYHFFVCPECGKFSADVRQGRGKRRTTWCSDECKWAVTQREKRAEDARKARNKGKRMAPGRKAKSTRKG